MKKISIFSVTLFLALVGLTVFVHPAQAEEEFTATIKKYEYRLPDLTVVGSPTYVKAIKDDTMLDMARRYGLGFNEVNLLYPDLDVWLPPDGKRIMMPTTWVLPPTQHEQLVINIAEMRLYFFEKAGGTVQTNPIGIGDEGWSSPLGTYFINEKRANPAWYIPASLQAKYGMAVMPPGPENPLGEFTMKFSAGPYGIHGTAQPWGVGRLVSHGCIRCYPEHIRILFPQVPIGTKLEIIYEPIKFGQKNGQVFVEIHPDVYRRLPDFKQYAMDKLNQFPNAKMVDTRKYWMAVSLQNGVPTDVTRLNSEGNLLKMVEFTQE
ncbi:MAG: L,D-transpeptidase family protein [Acidobacteriota bacterium]